MNRYALKDDAAEIDIIRVLQRLWVKKFFVLAFMTLGLLLAIFYVHEATPTYTAALRITPAASSTGNTASKASGLGGLAALAGITSLSSGGASPFELYLDAIQSKAVAARLARDPYIMRNAFANEWDFSAGRWREPRSVSKSFTSPIKSALGFPKIKWRAPDAGRLQDYISSSIVIEQDPKVPITKITFDHRNPAFATYLLSNLNKTADEVVRARSLAQASRYVDYLSRRLGSTPLAEHRQVLSTSLGEQERLVMMASSGLPYAATALEPPFASEQPTRPRVGMVLAGGVAAFGLLGIFFALLDLVDLARAVTARSDAIGRAGTDR